ncbi:testis-expressed protein 36 isoform X2 [Panthera pardus]|uniref:Testis-expressed protein 36 isoform X2 n=1 Tax=Panthera pardus TaxID=9691 RepID=A0A9W2W587_PANPR|nr:testis-expressed protein 36 isoform X2 [Panthera pardus]
MVRGRRFNPPFDQDGRWFPQIGLTQKTPESITSAMLKEPHSPRVSQQVEGRLPPIYKVREKQAVDNNFPFSVHDNRYSFQSSGCYLDSEPASESQIQEALFRLHLGAGLVASLRAVELVPRGKNECARDPGSHSCSRDYK